MENCMRLRSADEANEIADVKPVNAISANCPDLGEMVPIWTFLSRAGVPLDVARQGAPAFTLLLNFQDFQS